MVQILVALGCFAGGYFVVQSALRGTGRILGILFGAVLGLLGWFFPGFGKPLLATLIIAAAGLSVWVRRKKSNDAYSQLIFEGGGIRRGLTAVEVGTLLNAPAEGVLAVALTSMLEKGLIEVSFEGGEMELRANPEIAAGKDTLNPADRTEQRKAAARQRGKLLTQEEDMLLELFRQGQKPFSERFPLQFWLEKAAQECDFKMGGYDRQQSADYYRRYIGHRLAGVEKGFFPVNEFIPWMVLESFLNTQMPEFLPQLMKKTRPAWLPEGEFLEDWIRRIEAQRFVRV